jgi:hypothetical protein
MRLFSVLKNWVGQRWSGVDTLEAIFEIYRFADATPSSRKKFENRNPLGRKKHHINMHDPVI